MYYAVDSRRSNYGCYQKLQGLNLAQTDRGHAGARFGSSGGTSTGPQMG